eukprot:TRINITY_DN39247_c0_g1_i1.p1 TRINITY_DN39247_c0_g1~~TRINITY_DN39247_c0_g1_i1.p1  ORF type:complete len:384 (+),score=131.94 TRINITY_DN39247_c0_g1_i1:37-1188(+)
MAGKGARRPAEPGDCRDLLALFISSQAEDGTAADGAAELTPDDVRSWMLRLQHRDVSRFREKYKTAVHYVRSLAGLGDDDHCWYDEDERSRDRLARLLLPSLACEVTGPGGVLVSESFAALKKTAELRLAHIGQSAEELYCSLDLGTAIGAEVVEESVRGRQDEVHSVKAWYRGRSAPVDPGKAARDFEAAAPLGQKSGAFARRPLVYTADSADAVKGHAVYLSLLLAQAALLDDPFQKRVSDLCLELTASGQRCVHQPAPTKRASRVLAKLKNEYKATPEPREAQVLDFVRCLVLCQDAAAVRAAVEAVRAAFTVARVKNSFRREASGGHGWRAIVCNVVLSAAGFKQIAEVQISLTAIAETRSRMHTLYNIVRAEHPRDMR